jgi:hypothetical protein
VSLFTPARRYASLIKQAMLTVLAAGLLIWGGVAIAYLKTRSDIDYPGAVVRSKASAIKLSPDIAVKHDASFMTQDRFNAVYTWYSAGFDLGPENHATGACIQFGRSRKYLSMLNQDMNVQLCDTPNGTLGLVVRTFSVRYPEWLRSALTVFQL